MSQGDALSVKYAKWVVSHRLIVLFITFLMVGACGYGAQFLGFSTNYRVFFSDDNPQLNAFDALQKVYSKTDATVFVVKPKMGDVFQEDVIAAVQEITERSWQVPFAQRVDSLSNYQHTYAEGDDLTVIDLIETPAAALKDSDYDYIKNVALNEPLLVDRLISPNGATTGVVITHNFAQVDPFEVPKTAAVVREILDDVRAKYPDITIVPSGVVFMNNAFSEASMMDMQTLVPIMYAGLVVSMLIFLRSFFATFVTVFVIAFSAIVAMGLAGWAGIQLTPPSSTAPTIILTLAIADSIHIIVSMFKEMQRGASKNEAIIESLRINFQPVFLTSVTTMIGFLSLNFSDAPPFHDLGNITAMGVIAAFVFSVWFLPAALSLSPIKQKVRVDGGKAHAMEKLGDFVVDNRKWLLPVSSIVVIGLGVMIPKIELNDEFVKYFDHSISFRGDTEFMIENLTGIYQAEYSLGSGAPNGINNPEYLANMEKFADWLRSQPEVMHVYSLTDIHKRLNKNMHGDDPAWYKVPESQDMAAQYLLLYEFSLPYGLDLNDRINIDKSATRLTATLDDMSTVDLRAFKDRSEAWLKNNVPDYMHTEATSPVVMFAYISERNIDSMTAGNIIALVLISFCILFALKSVKLGFLSLVPNLTPAIMGFGIWALLFGQINMAVAVVAAVSLGIIVDDTVHFLSKYHRARREKGLGARDACRYAFSTVGSALTVTTFVLVVGFGILGTSAFQMNSSMGILTAITIACALVTDFFLLPPLLMLLDKKKSTEQSDKKEA